MQDTFWKTKPVFWKCGRLVQGKLLDRPTDLGGTVYGVAVWRNLFFRGRDSSDEVQLGSLVALSMPLGRLDGDALAW